MNENKVEQDEQHPAAYLYRWIGDDCARKSGDIIARTPAELGGDIDLCPDKWERIVALVPLVVPASATGHAALIGEALAVFDLMLDGCNDQKFGDFQNGHGEEIGPLMDALHAKLRAAVSGRAPSVPGGESESVDTKELENLLTDLAYARSEPPGAVAAAKSAIRDHVARQVQAAREQAAERAASICESHCACDNDEDSEVVNWVLRSRAAQIRDLLRSPQEAAITEKGAK